MIYYTFSENPIRGFGGDFFFLSNMYLSPVQTEIGRFRCSEAAYHAYKCADEKDIPKFYDVDGYRAKRLGKKISIRDDWEYVKTQVMHHVVLHKFQVCSELSKKLLMTGNRELIEENTWGDTFWGTVNGVGKNKLGLILMDVRRDHQVYQLTQETGAGFRKCRKMLELALWNKEDAITLLAHEGNSTFEETLQSIKEKHRV